MKNSTVIVTGGSQNIGLGIAQHFADREANVIIADLKPPAEQSATSYFVETNICEEGSVENLFATVRDQFGSIDVLVNNAGIAYESEFSETTLEQWDNTFAVNVRGVFLCSKYAVRQMKNQPQGSIVNIGSIEGLGANPFHAAYAASKGAVHSLTRNIAIDHGKDGVRCNAIAPGWINTPFNEAFVDSFNNPQQAMEDILKLHPLGELGQPKDIAQLAYWLASDESRFVNGQVLTIDGGRTAKLPLPAF